MFTADMKVPNNKCLNADMESNNMFLFLYFLQHCP